MTPQRSAPIHGEKKRAGAVESLRHAPSRPRSRGHTPPTAASTGTRLSECGGSLCGLRASGGGDLPVLHPVECVSDEPEEPDLLHQQLVLLNQQLLLTRVVVDEFRVLTDLLPITVRGGPEISFAH